MQFVLVSHHIEKVPVFIEGKLFSATAVVLIVQIPVEDFLRSEFPEYFIGIGITDRPEAWKQRSNH